MIKVLLGCQNILDPKSAQTFKGKKNQKMFFTTTLAMLDFQPTIIFKMITTLCYVMVWTHE
jgi:hypothetical protein